MVAQCQFCGNQFAVDDGTRRIEIVNEAQQLKNEIERQEYEAKRAAHEEFEKWMNNITSGEYEKYYEEMYKNR